MILPDFGGLLLVSQRCFGWIMDRLVTPTDKREHPKQRADMRSITIRPIVFLIFIITAVCGGATFEVQPGQRQLFIDDLGVAKIENLERNIHQPAKKGTVLRPIAPDSTSLQTRTAPVWDPQEKIFKFWVSGSKDPYRTSPDGLHWKSGSDPESHSHPSMAVRDPKDPDPTRRYKAALLNSGFAVSPDGIHWTKLDLPAISSSDEGNFSYNPKDGLFIHTVKRGGKHGRAVALATSRDFETWTDHGLIFQTDDEDQDLAREQIRQRFADPTLQHPNLNIPANYAVDVYNMGVFRYESLYIGMPAMFIHTGTVGPDWEGFADFTLAGEPLDYTNTHGDYTGFFHVQLVCSRDLKTWNRVAKRKPFMETSPLDSGAHDLQTIISPSTAVKRGQELWFYYTGGKGYGVLAAASPTGWNPDWYAVCLAVLRQDGFVSLDAADTAGTVRTRQFKLPGKMLFVNADAPEGELHVEVLDENDRVIARSDPLKGDMPATQVKWAKGTLDQAGQLVTLRFRLSHGRLYSYWFGK